MGSKETKQTMSQGVIGGETQTAELPLPAVIVTPLLTYYFEEVIECVAVEFKVQFLHDNQFHSMDVPWGKLTVVVLDHGN